MRTLFHYMLALGMLISGSINTLATKWADKIKSCGILEGEKRKFDHPFYQACGMFLGEFLCLFVYRFLKWRNADSPAYKKEVEASKPFNRVLLLLPALCDMTATSLMYVGLNLTYASVFQMLRGSVVIFTGIFTYLFLKRRLRPFRWLGMFSVMIGTVLVGVSGFVCKNQKSNDAPNQSAGNTIIILAQIVVAFQMVVEEKFISGYNIPSLQVVGWEGFWGFSVLTFLLLPMYYIPKPSALATSDNSIEEHFESAPDAAAMMGRNYLLSIAVVGTILSIAFFNFFGISVTKYLNAATRMVLDSVRTLVIWGFSLITGWQKFCWIQLIGFAILLTGTVIYNDVHPKVRLPYFNYDPYPEDEEYYKELEEEEDKDLITRKPGHESYKESPLFPSQDQLYTPTLGRAATLKQH
eukprot:gb/GECG01001588.1/.p1 GENE.gb/GECG01001588.1/~~gb/GECG01001588.1/.p1  ORF type:complete len:410 (+),score=26.20 gb/GECG01001588.1/:1-1230(+)